MRRSRAPAGRGPRRSRGSRAEARRLRRMASLLHRMASLLHRMASLLHRPIGEVHLIPLGPWGKIGAR